MLRAIIFDMDGVLCDSEPVHMGAFQQVLQEEGITLTDQEYYDRYLAYDDRDCFRAVMEANQRAIDAATIKQLMERKSRLFDEAMKSRVRIYPWTEPFVKKVSEQFPISVASGARRLEVEYVLKKANIRPLFTAIVSADDVQMGKPHPESFQKALALMNERRLQGSEAIEASECLVIEDSIHGLQAAHNAGMKCLALTTSYEAPQLKHADLVVDSLVGFEISSLKKLFGS